VHFYLQTPKKTTFGKENSNPNLQNTLQKTAAGAQGARHNVISSNTLIHASTKNSRMFKAMVSQQPWFLFMLTFFLSPHNVHRISVGWKHNKMLRKLNQNLNLACIFILLLTLVVRHTSWYCRKMSCLLNVAPFSFFLT
jgi:alkylated DNA repair dioxygenase AlkB